MNIKTFSIHAVRNAFAFFIALGIGYVAYTVNPTSVAPTKVEAGSAQNVSGFAWSENIGWISLNSTSDGSATSYGVNISPLTGTGVFSGYAWSENVGWITFNSGELIGCPSGTCNAQVDWATGKVTGWARVLSQTGDGWIKLSDDTVGVWNGKGVKIDTAAGKFSGYAWGSDSVGWIDFAPLINGVTPLPAPAKVAVPVACTLATADLWTPCDATASCVSGGSVTQSGLTGVRYGTCSNGDTGTVVDTTCVAPTTNCSAYAASHPGTYIVGDSRCDASAGETLANSPVDCKPKTKFWQF